PPASVSAGSGFGVIVAAEDPFGNLDSSYVGEVTLSLPGQGTGGLLGGTVTAPISGGLAQFPSVSITRAGSGYALAATSGGLDAATTSGFAVTPNAAAQLVIITQPPATVAPRRPFSLAVAAEDAFGNIASGFSGTVTAGLATNPGHNKLGGTLG